jgi:hypothetical protein
MKKKLYKNLLLEEFSDEEDSDVLWNKKKEIDEEIFIDEDDDIDINKLDEEDNDDNELLNFDMMIVQDQNMKKVRITFELNVMLNDKNKKICIDVMINKSTYLKLAEELN